MPLLLSGFTQGPGMRSIQFSAFTDLKYGVSSWFIIALYFIQGFKGFVKSAPFYWPNLLRCDLLNSNSS